MAGPVIEALRDRFGAEDESTVRERLENSPLLEKHQEELSKEIGDGGGCCDATMVARAMRNGQKYD